MKMVRAVLARSSSAESSPSSSMPPNRRVGPRAAERAAPLKRLLPGEKRLPYVWADCFVSREQPAQESREERRTAAWQSGAALARCRRAMSFLSKHKGKEKREVPQWKLAMQDADAPAAAASSSSSAAKRDR